MKKKVNSRNPALIRSGSREAMVQSYLKHGATQVQRTVVNLSAFSQKVEGFWTSLQLIVKLNFRREISFCPCFGRCAGLGREERQDGEG
jgi:hypothetical protein